MSQKSISQVNLRSSTKSMRILNFCNAFASVWACRSFWTIGSRTRSSSTWAVRYPAGRQLSNFYYFRREYGRACIFVLVTLNKSVGTFRENTFPQSHQKYRNREIVSFNNPDLRRLFLDSCFSTHITKLRYNFLIVLVLVQAQLPMEFGVGKPRKQSS